MHRIRSIHRESQQEITFVASRMRQTLIEVLGEEHGTALYSMDWLLDRVRWHLDAQRVADVFLIENEKQDILGHAIARVEYDDEGKTYGHFSTVFVEPRSRNNGLAAKLIRHVESWFAPMDLQKIVYDTAEDHSKLIRLFERSGYKITHRENKMVQLTKLLTAD